MGLQKCRLFLKIALEMGIIPGLDWRLKENDLVFVEHFKGLCEKNHEKAKLLARYYLQAILQ